MEPRAASPTPDSAPRPSRVAASRRDPSRSEGPLHLAHDGRQVAASAAVQAPRKSRRDLACAALGLLGGPSASSRGASRCATPRADPESEMLCARGRSIEVRQAKSRGGQRPHTHLGIVRRAYGPRRAPAPRDVGLDADAVQGLVAALSANATHGRTEATSAWEQCERRRPNVSTGAVQAAIPAAVAEHRARGFGRPTRHPRVGVPWWVRTGWSRTGCAREGVRGEGGGESSRVESSRVESRHGT